MSINLHLPPRAETLRPTITVFGVGGAGGNAVNNMIASQLQGVNFVVANTDAQALERSACERRIQLGINVTRGLGAGAVPEVGRDSAEEARDEIAEYIQGSNMVFITAGMGGGTGTGAAPVIARMAREQGILTVGVVTKPFQFEGTHRMRLATSGLEELQSYVDTLIVIPNQNLFRIANERTTFADAFKMADEVLHSGVRGVTDLMVMPGLINLDFADIRSVMREMGKAMMGTGEATGDNRAIESAEAAISNPLLDDVSMKGARGVLINITGGFDMTLFEVDEAANRIRQEVDEDANIIFGSTFSEEMEGKMRVSVVATGIEAISNNMPRPQSQQPYQVQQPREVKQEAPKAPAFHNSYQPAQAVNRAPVAAEPVREVQQQPQQQPQQPVITARPVQQVMEQEQPVAVVPKFTRTREEEHPQLAFNVEDSAAYAAPAAMAPVAAEPVMEQRTMEQRDVFMAPRPAQPQQRTHYAPRTREEEVNERPVRRVEEQKQAARPNLFQRLAGLGARQEYETQQQPQRRVEVVENPNHASRDAKAQEDYLDIPAFLRRQAN